MRRALVSILLCLVCGGVLNAQTSTIKSWSSYEDYCRDNPHAPTCVNGKPLKMDSSKLVLNPATTHPIQQPNSNTTPASSSKNPIRPSIITIPDAQPTREQLAAVKTLGLRPDWRFADPHAEMLLGINAVALRQSTTLRSLLVQLAPSLKLTVDDVDAQLNQMSDVDQFWISVQSGEAVILAQGPRVLAPAGPTNLDKGMVGYGLSRGAVLVGHPAPAAAAVQRLRNVAAGQSAAALQMKAQGVESDVWVMSTRAMLDKSKISSSTLMDGLSSYVLGVSLRNGLKTSLKLNYTTIAAARHALTFVQNSPPPPDWPVQVDSNIVGTAVRINVTVQEGELSRALDKAIAAPAAQPVLQAIAKSMQASSQATIHGLPGGPKTIQNTPAPPPGKMVIYGLPGGPKVM